ncbi:multidrug ABC transporter ATPase [Microbacterium candidum]|uniref:Multidrug ABC transporter ATPase n=1 Tax=Microbacterium candidum TaxID=3041922 RepID=A0ABT7N326_9MICO|nr:multidrug ABC transporter ATPase [Microbacterium sp. ASV49]MDL9981108.1 multidrug ABC transporter ATPase [Microbacterium sp. ASV49]
MSARSHDTGVHGHKADDVPVRRIDRILAYMALGITALTIVCFFAVILARPAGVVNFGVGLWPTIIVTMEVGLPIAFLMIVALLIMSFVRRARANRADDPQGRSGR